MLISAFLGMMLFATASAKSVDDLWSKLIPTKTTLLSKRSGNDIDRSSAVDVSVVYPGSTRASSFCAGAALSKKWVLVYASCVASDDGRIVVDVGATQASGVKLASVHVHAIAPLALLELTESLPSGVEATKIGNAPKADTKLDVRGRKAVAAEPAIRRYAWCAKRDTRAPDDPADALCAAPKTEKCKVKPGWLAFNSKNSELVAMATKGACDGPEGISWYERLARYKSDILKLIEAGSSSAFKSVLA